jgi:hypothetical protein
MSSLNFKASLKGKIKYSLHMYAAGVGIFEKWTERDEKWEDKKESEKADGHALFTAHVARIGRNKKC